MTQEYVAARLGMSRATYAQVERGNRVLRLDEAGKLAKIFRMSFDDLINEREEPFPIVEVGEGGNGKTGKTEEEIRISVPLEKAEKFKQVLLHVLDRIGSRRNASRTFLCRILYFIDFDYYEKYEEQLTGATYLKNEDGPLPPMFEKAVERLEKEDEVEKMKSRHHSWGREKYLVNPRKKTDLSALSSRELDHINGEIEKLANLGAAQIGELSRLDTPWAVAEYGKPLEYEHVFYRPALTSAREYEEL